MRRGLLFWLLIGVVQIALGQSEQLSFCTLTAEQGLSESSNSYVFKDSKGFVWVSSIDGLNRFDGRKTRVFRHEANNPNGLYGSNIQSQFFEDQAGDIWFTTDKAINCYRRAKGHFEHFFVRHKGMLARDKTHYAFQLDVDGILWLTASDTLYKFSTRNPFTASASSFVAPLPKAARCTVSHTKDGWTYLFASFWDYGPGFEMLKFDSFGQLSERKTFLDGTKITCYRVVCDKFETAWFSTSAGLLSFNPQQPDNWHLYPIPDSEGRSRSHSWLGDNQLLAISSKGHIWSFDTQKLSFKSIGAITANINSKMVEMQVKTINIASDNITWCSVPGNGLFYSAFSNCNFKNVLGETNVANINFAQVFEDELNQIWLIAFNKPVFLLKNRNCKEMGLDLGAGVLYRTDMGKTRFFSQNGWYDIDVASIRKNKYQSFEFNSIPTIHCAIQWKPGVLLVGTLNGLYSISEKTGIAEQVPLITEGVMSLFMDKNGLIWIGMGESMQVIKIDHNLSVSKIASFDQTGMVNQIAPDLKDDNKVWAATSNGLLQCRISDWSSHRIKEINGFVHSLVPDLNGRIWLGTNKGIGRYLPNSISQDSLHYFNQQNGLSSTEYCAGAALLARDGNIWFVGRGGVDVFHPDSITSHNPAPQLAIVGLKIHDHDWRDSNTCIEMAQRIELAYNENTLRLELAAMEYTFPEMNKFRVRLLKSGNDTSWVELGTQNFITYANLRPGNYLFEFTACNSEGIWQETPRQLEIIIHPHFTQTSWFPWLVGALALIVIGFGTAFYYRYRLRLQQLALEKQQREAERKQLLLENELALQEERNRIADEMHDELGGGLSTIRLASQRAKKVQSPEELQGILNRVSQISIGLVNNMRGIIWAMDSQNDSLRSLLAYIRQYAGTFLDDNGIAATLTLPTDFPDRPLSSQYRHHVMLTVKECLNNILKHADATAVELKIDLENQLYITIRDNGKGFEPVEHAGMGKGLRTTVKRMESIGGSIAWRRNLEGGMTVTLQAPLP